MARAGIVRLGVEAHQADVEPAVAGDDIFGGVLDDLQATLDHRRIGVEKPVQIVRREQGIFLTGVVPIPFAATARLPWAIGAVGNVGRGTRIGLAVYPAVGLALDVRWILHTALERFPFALFGLTFLQPPRKAIFKLTTAASTQWDLRGLTA